MAIASNLDSPNLASPVEAIAGFASSLRKKKAPLKPNGLSRAFQILINE
jgi:hypothetical protein